MIANLAPHTTPHPQVSGLENADGVGAVAELRLPPEASLEQLLRGRDGQGTPYPAARAGAGRGL